MGVIFAFLLALVMPVNGIQIRHRVGHKMQGASMRVIPDGHVTDQEFTPSVFPTNNPQLSIKIALHEKDTPCLICAVERGFRELAGHTQRQFEFFRRHSLQGPAVVGYAYLWLCVWSAVIYYCLRLRYQPAPDADFILGHRRNERSKLHLCCFQHGDYNEFPLDVIPCECPELDEIVVMQMDGALGDGFDDLEYKTIPYSWCELVFTSFFCFPIRWSDNAHRLGYMEFWQAFVSIGGLFTATWVAIFHAPFLVPSFLFVTAFFLLDFRHHLRAGDFDPDDFEEDVGCCGGEPCCTGVPMALMNYLLCPCFTLLQESRHTEFLLRKNEKLRTIQAASANFRVRKQPIAARCA